MPVAAQNRRAQGRPVVDLPRGAVRQVILDSCTACHGIDDYAYYAMDRAGWQKMIDSMKAKGANISDDNQSILLDWLSTKFGPDTKPFPRTYVPPEITTFFSDPEAKRPLDRACTSCHMLDRVDNARYPEERWRVLVVDMRERGAKLSDEEVERLVEWLGRVWGTNQDK